jgi:hypothetical protein
MKHLKTFESVASSRRYTYNFLKMDDNLVQILHNAEDEGLEVFAGMTFQSDVITISMPYYNGAYNFNAMSEQRFKSICDTIGDRIGELYNVDAGDYKTKRGIPCEYSIHIYKDGTTGIRESVSELPSDEIEDILNIARDEGLHLRVEDYGSFYTASISHMNSNGEKLDDESFKRICKEIEERMTAIVCTTGSYINNPNIVGYTLTYWV